MATVPTPFDPAPGDKLSAAQFDAGVRDPLTWMMTNRPKVHAFSSSAISLANNADTLITFNSENYDTDSMHSTSVNTSRVTFNTSGVYTVRVGVQLPSAAYSSNNINPRVNSAEVSTGGTALGPIVGNSLRYVQWSFEYGFTAGDHFQFWVLQDSGGAINTGTGMFRCFVQALWQTN